MYREYSPETDIFENGILIIGAEDPPSSRKIATNKLPVYSNFNITVLDNDGLSLNEMAVGLALVKGPHSHADYYDEYDLRYWVLSSLYRVTRLIELYVWNVEVFENQYPLGTTTSRGNIHGLNVYYEIDAFLTSARRVYDTLSYVLWKHYHPSETGRWDGMKSAVKRSLSGVPSGFAGQVLDSWNQFGLRLRDYRDCVIHHIPLHETNETCWLSRYEKHWQMTVKLPANPEKKSRRLMDYDSGPDALSYCYEVANHLVKLCTALNQQEKIASYLALPPR
ncbi:MAG: hypothetical protein ABL999_07625 [Pyrinomonadaceae bacterium]